ncbi:MAG: hypothetical protein AB1746_14495 [Candidatus Zixiibacteriota bacterium]
MKSVKKIVNKDTLSLLTIFLLLIPVILGSDIKTGQSISMDTEDLPETPAAAESETSLQGVPTQAAFLSPGDTICWQVVGSGATSGNSEQYLLSGTLGQSAIGLDSTAVLLLRSGFWQFFCDCNPGDADGNGIINLLDVTFLITYLYRGGPAPRPFPLCSGDPDCSCMVNILDVTYLISYLYKGGIPPCECEDWLAGCGQPLRK